MQTLKKAAVFAGAVAAFGWAATAAADTITITFERVNPIATPISPWAAAAIAAMLALTAVALLRAKGVQRFFVLMVAMAIGSSALVPANEVQALAATPLVNSPYVETFGGCPPSPYSRTFISGGGTIRILSVTDTQTGDATVLTGNTTCVANLLLSGAATCLVETTSPPPC